MNKSPSSWLYLMISFVYVEVHSIICYIVLIFHIFLFNSHFSKILSRFKVDEMHDINIIEWNKKRKLHGYQLDLLRPKNKCRVENVSSEGASMLNESSILESADNHTVNSRVDASSAEDRSEPESAKDSNSFIEDSDTSMSVNEEAKPDADCANAYLCGKPSTSFLHWHNYNVTNLQILCLKCYFRTCSFTWISSLVMLLVK